MKQGAQTQVQVQTQVSYVVPNFLASEFFDVFILLRIAKPGALAVGIGEPVTASYSQLTNHSATLRA